MEWYNYLAALFSGAFFANTIPHFIKGVCGDRFPTPFSKPPGKGLSTPVLNVIWALVNLLVAFLLLKKGNLSLDNYPALGTWFFGFALLSLLTSKNFSTKHKE